MRTELLRRVAATAGIASAAVLCVNAAKRAGVLATTDLTQLLAPFAQIFALVLVTALYFTVGRRRGTLGLVGYALTFVSLGLLVGVEVVLNLVFPALDPATIGALREGPLGILLTVASVLFLVATAVFLISLWQVSGPPRVALVLYGVGAIPIALRAFVPEVALQAGLLVLAAGIVWLSVWMIRLPASSDVGAAEGALAS